MQSKRSLHHLAAWCFPVVALVAVSITVSDVAGLAARQGEPFAPTTVNARAYWSAGAGVGLAVALVALLFFLIPLQRLGRTRRSTVLLARIWAIGIAVSMGFLLALRLNAVAYGRLWSNWEQVGSLRVPAAVLEPRLWTSNIGLTIATAVAAFALMALLERVLVRVAVRPAPRALSVLGAVPLVVLAVLVLLPPTAGVGIPAGPDVVVIALDGVRADRLGPYGGPAGLTPALERFADDAIRFDGARTVAIEHRAALAALLTGDLDGIDARATDRTEDLPARAIDPSRRTLAETMRAVGYRTVSSRTATPRAGVDPSLDDGFTRHAVDGRAAAARAHAAARAVEDADRPFLLFVEFGDARADDGALPYESNRAQRNLHAPDAETHFADWSGPAGARESLFEVGIGARRLSEVQADALGALYDASVAEVDAGVGALLGRLRAAGRYEDALVIVVGTRGQALGEEGVYLSEAPIDAVTRVPLFVKLPGGDQARTVQTGDARTVDVAATVLALVGQPVAAELEGRPLVPIPGE